jgi:hypothetical protein
MTRMKKTKKTTRFERIFKCWSCGRRISDGRYLDCITCHAWLCQEIDQAKPGSEPWLIHMFQIVRHRLDLIARPAGQR